MTTKMTFHADRVNAEQVVKWLSGTPFLEAAKSLKWSEDVEVESLNIRWDLFWTTMDCERVNRKMNKRFSRIMNLCDFLIQTGHDPHEVLTEAWEAIQEWVLREFDDYGSNDSEPRIQAIRLLNFYATRWIKWSYDDRHLIHSVN